MNSNYSNNQLFGFENLSQVTTGSRVNMDAQNSSIHLSNQYIVQDNFVINQPVHPIKFIYQPPNDLHIYHINCKEISIQLLNDFSSNVSNISFNQNEYIFFYQRQNDNQIYQIVCEMVSPSFIINLLNRAIYGIEIEQNIRHEELTFRFDQKENLKFYLTQYLNHYF
jgi:hypothetical protein